MISILRKFRHQRISEDKLISYFIYALGEIVLVVIGILIAVAINDIQQQKLLHKKEQAYLIALKDEFETSKLKLTELIEINRLNYLSVKKILEYNSNPKELLTEKQFSELLFRSFSFDIAFNANNAVLNEMIYSGSLKDISNNQLRARLTNWESRMEDISGQEDELRIQRKQVLDMFRNDKNSIKTILELTTPSSDISYPGRKKRISNLELLGSLKFENNILMFYLTSYSTEKSHYNPLMKELDAILNLIEAEIKQ